MRTHPGHGKAPAIQTSRIRVAQAAGLALTGGAGSCARRRRRSRRAGRPASPSPTRKAASRASTAGPAPRARRAGVARPAPPAATTARRRLRPTPSHRRRQGAPRTRATRAATTPALEPVPLLGTGARQRLRHLRHPGLPADQPVRDRLGQRQRPAHLGKPAQQRRPRASPIAPPKRACSCRCAPSSHRAC